MKAVCRKDVIAVNTSNKLFIKGEEYNVRGLGVGGTVSLKDEFGCIQRFTKNEYKLHFESLGRE